MTLNSIPERSPVLTPKEIEESIDASENLIAVIDYINAMQYRSEIKEFRRSLPSVAAKNRFNPDEVDVLAAALDQRDFELSAKSIGVTSTQEEWSPSGIIDWLPRPNTSRDSAQRAANDRHDIDE